MVAIAIARQVFNSTNVDIQFSAEELSLELNLLPHSNGSNLYVDQFALKHGFQMFRTSVIANGITPVPMFHEEKYLTTYFHLGGSKRSTEENFTSVLLFDPSKVKYTFNYFSSLNMGKLVMPLEVKEVRNL